MKQLITAVLLMLSSSAAMAQHHDANGQYYSDSKDRDIAWSEIGISTGFVFSFYTTAAARLQILTRMAPSLQIGFIFTYLGGSDVTGPGVCLNFPIGRGRSYFYPGLQGSYYFDGGHSFGVHTGYNAALSKRICFNIEPEASIATVVGKGDLVVQLLVGMRVAL